MTRPIVVRADTLDLQGQDSPSAKDHSQHNLPAGTGSNQLGPHQAAEIRHVQQERQSEELNLQDAWNQAVDDQNPQSPSQYRAGVEDSAHDDRFHSQHNGTHNHQDGEHTDDEDPDQSEEDDDDMMDRMSSSPSIDDEDIDFDFVYALHTFVATVEGQANATKGDTMVLLDDSNSYWWLVRIVKDSSIGYLPAEHIETPTERLARLNKHRNVDLSQAMLGDNMEKSKNPLKKAMRRRNAKTVQFAAPTYVEASDYEYDTEDEESALLADAYNNASAQGEEGPDTNHAEHRELGDGSDETRSRMSDSSGSDDAKDVKPPIEEPLGSPTLVDSTEAAPLKSRKGTPRNADSFLKDDSAEPRRITLTPNILRDDGSSMSSLEKTRSTSFESVEKVAAPPEKVKDEKKKKEKKQGMLSGLFRSKKKDKKGKSDEDGAGETEKVSGEHSRQNSGQTSPVLDKSMSNPDKRGKLQKTQPAPSNGNMMAAAPAAVAVAPVSFEPATQQTQQHTQSSQARAEEPPTQFFAELEGSQVAYEAPTGQEEQIRDIQSRQSTRSPEAQPQLQQSSSMAALTAITNRMRPNSDEPQMKKQKVKKAKQRVELDDFDALSEEDEDEEEPERLSESPVDINHNTYMHGTEAVHIPMNIEDRDNSTPGQQTPDERASEDDERTSSPSMIDVPTEGNHLDEEAKQRSTTNLSEGTETTDDDPTPVPSGPQSPAGAMFQPWQSGLPHLKHAPTPPPARSAPFPPATKAPQQGEESMQRSVVTPSQAYPRRAPSLSSTASTRPSPSPSPVSATDSAASKGSWSDASLRAWLDGGEGNDIKDMLVVIHDKSNVQPVSRDHPLMQGLWTQERSTCSRMMGELDGLLSGFLGKKQYRSKGGLFSSASKGVTTTAAASGGDANKPISSIGSTTTTPPVVGA
ncbi:hypothetical protein AAFC00_002809 [Neodothiora populina]|uniref:SH3 domain-containing protein n=1 Tax=Neodothiora populina TaxID=2781224 RepID=A0ABR3P8B7_9PEZI